jgi:hypothetical protein
LNMVTCIKHKTREKWQQHVVDDPQLGLLSIIYEDGKIEGPFQRPNSGSAS